MSIKHNITFVILLITSLWVSAKNPGDISATLKDSLTKEPIAFATVELLTGNDSLLTGCITNSEGYFEIAPPANATKVRIRYMGYKKLEMALTTNELDVVYLKQDDQELNEVTVNRSARINKIDGDVYTITKSLAAGTHTSQELLGKLSGVTYNYYDKSISVNGNTKVLILVDGIEKDQNYAKNLPPDRIERIEVIKDPVGIYATDGYSAVINLVMKKDYSGIDASLNNSAFFDFVGTNGDDLLLQDYGNINLNYTNRNFNLYSTASLTTNDFNLATDFLKQYGDVVSETSHGDLQNPNTFIKTRNKYLTLGAEYTFAKKHTVATEFKYANSYDSNSIFYNITNSLNNSAISNSSSETYGENNTINLMSAVIYKGKFDDNNSLDADVRYYRTDGYNYGTFEQDNFSSLSDIDLAGDYIRTNISYDHKFSPKLSSNLGYSNVYFSNTNSQNGHSFTRYNYRNRASVYLNYRPSEKINTKVGGIIENYTQRHSGNEENMTAILPYINVQYTPNQTINFIARYHSNADYPSINELNPYKIALDSLIYSAGNPDLKTAIKNKLGLDINILNFITLAPYYEFNHSQIATYIDVDPENNSLFLTQTVNVDSYSRLGANLDFSLPFGKRIFLKNTIGFNQSKMAYDAESYQINNWTLNSNLIYMLQERGMMAGLILQKQTYKQVAIQGYNTTGSDLLLVMLRKSFMKDKLNLGLFYTLPVELGLNYNMKNVTIAQSYKLTSNANLNLIKNMVFFEISYRFTKGKEVKNKQVSSDGEMELKQKSGFGL